MLAVVMQLWVCFPLPGRARPDLARSNDSMPGRDFYSRLEHVAGLSASGRAASRASVHVRTLPVVALAAQRDAVFARPSEHDCGSVHFGWVGSADTRFAGDAREEGPNGTGHRTLIT